MYGSKERKLYLEAENAADKEQHNEDQPHAAKSRNLLFVGKVVRLQSQSSQSTSETQGEVKV